MESAEASRSQEHMFALFESCLKEAESIELERNEKGDILAPNGLVSELREHELLCKVVRTSTFKKWFGDWEQDPKNASRAVYLSTGEPRLVFHATPKSIPITEGVKPMPQKQWNDLAFFSSDPHTAVSHGSYWEASEGNKTVTYPCFLNIRMDLMRDVGEDEFEHDGIITGGTRLIFAVRYKEQILHVPINSVAHDPRYSPN